MFDWYNTCQFFDTRHVSDKKYGTICAELFLQFRNSSFAVRVGQIYDCDSLQNIVSIKLNNNIIHSCIFVNHLKYFIFPFTLIFVCSLFYYYIPKYATHIIQSQIVYYVIFHIFGISLNHLCSSSKQFLNGTITDPVGSAGDKHGFLLNLHYVLLFSRRWMLIVIFESRLVRHWSANESVRYRWRGAADMLTFEMSTVCDGISDADKMNPFSR